LLDRVKKDLSADQRQKLTEQVMYVHTTMLFLSTHLAKGEYQSAVDILTEGREPVLSGELTQHELMERVDMFTECTKITIGVWYK
jgi:hypothetical protein